MQGIIQLFDGIIKTMEWYRQISGTRDVGQRHKHKTLQQNVDFFFVNLHHRLRDRIVHESLLVWIEIINGENLCIF